MRATYRRILRKLTIEKKQRFIVSVILLSLGLFISAHLFGRSGIAVSFLFSFITDFFLFWALYRDLKDTFVPHVFIIPFLYSLSFSLFYFLVPSRFLTRFVLTSLYALGLYALFRSQNIFLVASIRTIALLVAARIVSLVITIVTYFFLSNIVFSLHATVFITAPLIFLISFLLIQHSLWTYALDKPLSTTVIWSFVVSLCIFEISLILWFWPTNPTVIALFLTGFFYTFVSLSQVWFDRRLFRGVLWEYIWVSFIVLFVLILFTTWR